jgi:hypothetical protein
VLKGAQIVFAHRGAAIDCMVRNISDGGACLKVFSPVGIPDSFELRLDSDSVRYCRVVWRKATQIGVEFTWPLAPPNAGNRDLAAQIAKDLHEATEEAKLTLSLLETASPRSMVALANVCDE